MSVKNRMTSSVHPKGTALFDSGLLRRLEAEVDPANAASGALLRSLGFAHEGRLRQRWTAKGRTYDVDAFGLLAGELMRR